MQFHQALRKGVGVGGGWDSNSTAKWTHPLDKGPCLTKYRTLPSWISLLHSTHSSIHSSCLSLRHISWNSNSEWQRRCTRWSQEANARVRYVSDTIPWHPSNTFIPGPVHYGQRWICLTLHIQSGPQKCIHSCSSSAASTLFGCRWWPLRTPTLHPKFKDISHINFAFV